MATQFASLDELETLLSVELSQLQDLERAAQAAGSNSGVAAELETRRNRVSELRDRIRDYEPPVDQPDALTLADPASTEAAIDQIIERTRPSGIPAKGSAFRIARGDGVPRLGEGHTAVVRTGQYGRTNARPVASPQAAPEPQPTPTVSPPLAAGSGCPLAFTRSLVE